MAQGIRGDSKAALEETGNRRGSRGKGDRVARREIATRATKEDSKVALEETGNRRGRGNWHRSRVVGRGSKVARRGMVARATREASRVARLSLKSQRKSLRCRNLQPRRLSLKIQRANLRNPQPRGSRLGLHLLRLWGFWWGGILLGRLMLLLISVAAA